MKRLCAAATAVLVLGGAALAQTSGSGIGTSGPPGSSNTPSGSFNPTPNIRVTPGITTGRGPGINPSNPQDMIGRSNPQDRTTPRARNPQDRTGGGVPQIMAPER